MENFVMRRKKYSYLLYIVLTLIIGLANMSSKFFLFACAFLLFCSYSYAGIENEIQKLQEDKKQLDSKTQKAKAELTNPLVLELDLGVPTPGFSLGACVYPSLNHQAFLTTSEAFNRLKEILAELKALIPSAAPQQQSELNTLCEELTPQIGDLDTYLTILAPFPSTTEISKHLNKIEEFSTKIGHVLSSI